MRLAHDHSVGRVPKEGVTVKERLRLAHDHSVGRVSRGVKGGLPLLRLAHDHSVGRVADTARDLQLVVAVGPRSLGR